MMLSSTDSQPKVCWRWKVRRMPLRARHVTDRPVTSTPSYMTRPAVGGRIPEMVSNSVVLPAPLGPIRPHTSPAKKSVLTSLTATTPPKRTVIPWVCRSGVRDSVSTVSTAATAPAYIWAPR